MSWKLERRTGQLSPENLIINKKATSNSNSSSTTQSPILRNGNTHISSFPPFKSSSSIKGGNGIRIHSSPFGQQASPSTSSTFIKRWTTSPQNKSRGRRKRGRGYSLWTIISRVAIPFSLMMCNLGSCDDHFSHENHLGVWSHFAVVNTTTGEENYETESSRSSSSKSPIAASRIGPSSGLRFSTGSRRSRMTDFEFPDGDLSLMSDEAMGVGGRIYKSGPCRCWNTTSDLVDREVECKCSGSNFTHLHGVTVLPNNVHRLTVERAKNFTTLSNEDLRPYGGNLSELILSELPQLREIKSGTFLHLPHLNTIYIHGAQALKEIPDDVFRAFLPKLKLIRMTYTALETVPNFSHLHVKDALHMVELENGKIANLPPGSFNNLKTAHLSLSYNMLEEIGPRAFNGSTIARLGLNGNRQLRTLHPDSFLGIEFLSVLDLSETSITYLPTSGLQGLEVLRVENVWTLNVIPSIYHFQNLKEASLTWPYHCCAFENPEAHDPVTYQAYQEYVRTKIQDHCAKAAVVIQSPSSTFPSVTEGLSLSHKRYDGGVQKRKRRGALNNNKFRRRDAGDNEKEKKDGGGSQAFPIDSYDPFILDPERSFGDVLDSNTGGTLDVNPWDVGVFGDETESQFDDEVGIFHHQSVDPSPTVITVCGNVSVRKHPKVHCSPVPDAFNPCEDIMGSVWLRGAVWVVVSLALVGNTAVLVVLLLAPGRMSVQRFLMANLSWADMCMGFYLLMVATQDLISLGSYFNYAIDWQLGWGCQIAGFLTVFASELSVFTLTVITGERWYALTRAIHLTKRLNIVGAAQLMSIGWVLSMILAGLPLLGVSSFSKTSICLPMDVNSMGSVTYLAFLLLFNGVAFLMVATAYWQMYRAVAGNGHSASSAADLSIAKKMGLLVFTDFMCWAPVAFFGLTAVGGFPLIGVTDSKILLVFFYPLNSTLNPYLYAIMTKQYRRDLLLLLSRHGICTKRAARYKTGGAVSTNHTLQTMQTVLRLGSLTETKAINLNVKPSQSDAGHEATTNGGGNVSEKKMKVGQDETGGGETSQPLPPRLPPIVDGVNNAEVKKEEITDAAHIFEHPLLQSSNCKVGNNRRFQPEQQDDDNLNGVNGRMVAETSFISIPSSFYRKDVMDPEGSTGHEKLLQPEDDNELEAEEASEITPFCLKKHSISG